MHMITRCTETAQSLEQFVLLFDHPQSKKKASAMFSWVFLCVALCPLPLDLSQDATGKSLAPSLLPTLRYLGTWKRSP